MMEMEVSTNLTNNSGFHMDPRTKIFILIILSFMVFNDAPLYIAGILVLIPFISLFLSNHKKIAITYIILYLIATYLKIYVNPNLTGPLTMISASFTYTVTRMLPVIIMGTYTVLTTKVSEFVASMEEIHIPKYIIIPLSVIFRYLPTIYEEIKSIRNAMRMRGLGLNFKTLKTPLKLVEFYMIPILISAVKTSDELSAASLTRGLSNPQRRTHLEIVKFSKTDTIFMILTILGIGMYLYYFIGDILLV